MDANTANFAVEPGSDAAETADEFCAHLTSVEQWRQRWNKLGLAGLYEKRHTGRLRKWTPQQQSLANWRIPRAEAYLTYCKNSQS
jgi:transposase